MPHSQGSALGYSRSLPPGGKTFVCERFSLRRAAFPGFHPPPHGQSPVRGDPGPGLLSPPPPGGESDHLRAELGMQVSFEQSIAFDGGGMISNMAWWQIPLFIVVAIWALYLYSTPSAKVMEHVAKLRDWWKSRRT